MLILFNIVIDHTRLNGFNLMIQKLRGSRTVFLPSHSTKTLESAQLLETLQNLQLAPACKNANDKSLRYEIDIKANTMPTFDQLNWFYQSTSQGKFSKISFIKGFPFLQFTKIKTLSNASIARIKIYENVLPSRDDYNYLISNNSYDILIQQDHIDPPLVVDWSENLFFRNQTDFIEKILKLDPNTI
ncbi:uncharacterized protein ASCRUDRAFT_79018 [Ascoidea rubescens DSM 1968]|uniref:Uncharacterized protein n=1 Tax=Ascoidea rubescens DSM 1968 TaxID=1344418 RepID=A0A1D2VR68_9ASCO|nr:hypothetical protein ASCRUDRAFT_79018 [Ascoidea rubescens DSM 1968]ODV64089.1 hypothetical protein ASCRUDRAFT_79018 [Ascoidea rubescens DSM 1968]